MTVHTPREVIFEFVQQGAYVKVSAVDTCTGIEGVIVGDANAPREKLQALALQKLEYVLKKRGQK